MYIHVELNFTLAFERCLSSIQLYTWISLKSRVPYIGNFSRREILAKMMLGWCVKFSLSPIFAISWTLNEDV